jgi:hypothetical protein
MQARFSTPSSLAAHHRRLMASCAESGCPQVRQTSGPKLSARTVGESLCMSKSVEAHYKGHCEDQGPTNRMSAAMFSGSPHRTRATMSDRTEHQVTSETADEATGTRRLADAAVVCCGRSGRRRMSEVSRRRRSSRSRFDAAGHQGPALESPWEFFLAASLVPERVLTLPHWRKRKQRLP